MITVKLYGLFRISAGKAVFEFEKAKDLNEVVSLLAQNSEVSSDEWKQAVLYVNGVPIDKLKMFRTKINDGDIISVLSPASGG